MRKKLEPKITLTKKILISGGTGFIGYHLAKKCLNLNWSVDSISTKLPKKKENLKKLTILRLIFSKKKLKKNFKK